MGNKKKTGPTERNSRNADETKVYVWVKWEGLEEVDEMLAPLTPEERSKVIKVLGEFEEGDPREEELHQQHLEKMERDRLHDPVLDRALRKLEAYKKKSPETKEG